MTIYIQISLLIPLLPNSGLDASPPASTHELTIPNDVSVARKVRNETVDCGCMFQKSVVFKLWLSIGISYINSNDVENSLYRVKSRFNC